MRTLIKVLFKLNLKPHLIPHTIFNSKWITVLTLTAKITTFPEKKVIGKKS